MSQYLGDISAYALAVSQGYTGTEEEYAELMASYATVGQTAVTAAQTATTKASEAATSATTATNKASEATTAATTATTKAGEASTSASTAASAKDTAVSAASTATTKATEATTAAATATSAKTDAVAANTAAQSAKTAAQTAQTGAETAAASVEASAAQIATNTADISQLKSDLSNANAGKQTFRGLGNFQHYGLNPDGSFLTSQKYRVSNNDAMTFDRDITISVATGFKWGYITFVQGTAQTWAGWFTTNQTIPAGTSFVVQIARTTENTSETADVSTFLNALTFNSIVGDYIFKIPNIESNISDIESTIGISAISTSWVQGGVASDGDTVDSARIRTGFLPIADGIHVDVKTGYSAVVVQYDSEYTFLSGTSWTQGSFDIAPLTNAKYYKVVLSKGNGSGQSISVSDSTNVSFNNIYTDIAMKFYQLSSNASGLIDGHANQYFGEKIPSLVNSFDFVKVLRMTYTSDSAQDIDIFNGYLFVAFSGSNSIKVYSLEDKKLKATMPVDVQHGTGMQFSNDYYDAGDDFPLLYVGGWNTNIINVVRITKSNDTWSASIIKKLVIPTNEGYYFAPSIDVQNNIMYCYGYKNNDNHSYDNNKMRLIKCDLSNLTDNEDDTFTPEIIDRIETPYMGIMQGRKYYNGRLYVGFANTGSPFDSRLVSIDVETGQTKADIDMTAVTTSENEGVCYQIVGNNIYWHYSDYYDVFKILF